MDAVNASGTEIKKEVDDKLAGIRGESLLRGTQMYWMSWVPFLKKE